MCSMLSGVPETAFLAALARRDASESHDVDFTDPYAKRFAALCPPSILSIANRTIGISVMASRSKIMDDIIVAALEESSVDCVVNLGAGFDSRPYRIKALAAIRCIEIDLPAIVELKDTVLPADEAPGQLIRVDCDLRDVGTFSKTLARYCAGYDVLLVSEGVLVYLSADQLSALARTCNQVGFVTAWITDILSVQSADYLSRRSRQQGYEEVGMYGLRDLSVFESCGFQCTRYIPLPSATSFKDEGLRSERSHYIVDGILQFNRLPLVKVGQH